MLTAAAIPASSTPTSPSTGRRVAPIVGAEWWRRCGHHDTTVDLDHGDVRLASDDIDGGADWLVPPGAAADEPLARLGRAGLAFDGRGCLYRGEPERGQLQRVRWPRTASGDDAVDLLRPARRETAGEEPGFVPVDEPADRPLRARALAADEDEHLFVLDGTTDTVAVLDVVDGRSLRSIAMPAVPVDLAGRGDRVLVAARSRNEPFWVLDVLSEPRPVELRRETRALIDQLPPGALPARVAAGPGAGGGPPAIWLLWSAGDPADRSRSRAAAWLVPVDGAALDRPHPVPGATDLEIDGRGRVVTVGPADRGLRTWQLDGGQLVPSPALDARGHDGRGIVRTPDGRIGFWTGRSFRVAHTARARYRPSGYVDTYRLDSEAYRQPWGRVFVEACIPPGTSLRIGFATSDDLPGTFDPHDPDGFDGLVEAPLTGGDPSLPLAPGSSTDLLDQTYPLHRRETGREQPWARADAGDRFEVYEVPTFAPPGRYLWLRLRLDASTATTALDSSALDNTTTPLPPLGWRANVTPRIRAVRVEVPGHDLVERLPRTYRREPVAAAFLRRYLAMVDGMLTEVEQRAAQRDLLLDPHGAPVELLPWLGSLIGLTLDDRWSEAARRTLLAEAMCLFRRRGTIAGLRRLLEIYLECPVVILEAFRLRGPAFTQLGSDDGTAMIGWTRVGGEQSLGRADATDDEPAGVPTERAADAFRTHAHRFTVLISRELSVDERATVDDLLDQHRPAHTVVDVCTIGRGMRVGVGLHLGISTLVGSSAGFPPAEVGTSRIGGGTILGHGRAGIRPGTARLGHGTVVDL